MACPEQNRSQPKREASPDGETHGVLATSRAGFARDMPCLTTEDALSPIGMAPQTPAGYRSQSYVESLRHLGEPVRLDACGGWLLRRAIPSQVPQDPAYARQTYDCIGPYPLFLCHDWQRVAEDLQLLRSTGMVSATIVPDPFGGYSPPWLESVFDVVRPIKQRSVVDLTRDLAQVVSRHHQQSARRALTALQVERCADPPQYADEWVDCYRAFARDRSMSGPADVPPAGLVRQLSTPGLHMYRASAGGRTLGFSLWMVHDTLAYGHLAAHTTEGREAGVAYAFYWTILGELQRQGVTRVDLGGGVEDSDGLARWKAGWTPETVPSLVCGAILRPDEYAMLTRARGTGPTAYFPAYRAPS